MLLSITGLFKTILILIGVFVLLRFLGQLMIAKRNLAEHNALRSSLKKQEVEKNYKKNNQGKISILKENDKQNKQDFNVHDVDFEEVK